MGPEESGPLVRRGADLPILPRLRIWHSRRAELENGASVGSSPHEVKKSRQNYNRGVVAGVILAAGRSSRMGRAKALLRQVQSGHTFVGHLIRTALAAALNPVFVVVRRDDIYLRDEIARYGASAIVNADPDAGQLSSIQAALPAIEASGARAMVLMPGDSPLIATDDVNAVVAACEPDHIQIVRATHKGVHGHPVLFKRAMFDELRAADPQVGARVVVRADVGRVLDVEVSNPGVTLDIDTPEDYRRAFGRSL